jgi:hypothetical protein
MNWKTTTRRAATQPASNLRPQAKHRAVVPPPLAQPHPRKPLQLHREATQKTTTPTTIPTTTRKAGTNPTATNPKPTNPTIQIKHRYAMPPLALSHPREPPPPSNLNSQIDARVASLPLALLHPRNQTTPKLAAFKAKKNQTVAL